MFKFIFRLSHRNWQKDGEAAEAKLQTLTSQLNELRERFKQAQREVETQEVRFE
jgi:multidrug resistance efflux pump